MVNEISYNKANSSLYAYKSLNVDISNSSTVLNPDGSQTATTESVSLRSESTSALTYNGSMKLQDLADSGYDKLRAWVANLLQEQGINTKIASNDSEVDIATIDPGQAQDLISENGYFGVKQTSERIFQFAIGVAGGDTSRITAIKEGIDKGFAEAKKAFGDWLPDISYNTYDAVMKKLDDWVAQSETVA
ncbi:MAG: hypothetical protein PHI97_18035 [Desulfobulbus sp.]|nr:hypothetical protein [Desulfobulbus sp.]